MGHFGTDGIRKKAVEFTTDYLNKIADGIAALGAKKVVVGRDPRVSGEGMAEVLFDRLNLRGVETVDCAMIPTPVLSYMTGFLDADYGVMLSASHNPPEYNGVKLFARSGAKVSSEEEAAVERVIDNGFDFPKVERGGCYFYERSGDRYAEHLMEMLKPDLSGLAVALDCANGATSFIAPEVFEKAGAKVVVYNDNVDGTSINCGCGATVPSFIAEKSKEEGVDVAFCYDGDGDRMMAAKDGKIFDGDKVMYLCAKELKAQGKLNQNVVVGTVMSNMGTEVAMKKAGITLVRADVGDKYVSREMVKNGYNVGGEQSGHLIFSDYAPTGDGILSSLFFAALAKKTDIKSYDDIVDYPAINDCILCTEKEKASFLEREGEIRKYLSGLTDCRTVVRPSGTEPKIRILAEAKTEEVAKTRCAEIKKYITEMIL